MKRFYIILLAMCILFSVLLYLPVVWFLSAAVATAGFMAYRFYLDRFRSGQARNELLAQQMEQLHAQLDQSIFKEERAVKEAGQIKLARQDLLSVMSHEVRTPMNGVLGMLTLLTETSLTPEQSEYTLAIRNCGEGLLTKVNDILVNELLNSSKWEQGDKQLEKVDFDLRNCLEEVIDMFALRAAKNNLDLLYYMDEQVPEQITGDNRRLRQIIMNLVENAIKFTRRGEIFLNVYLDNDGPPMLVFEVRDTGVGMDEDQVKLLFTGIPGTAFNKDGNPEEAGLGLVVCRKLVELMEGKIEAKSLPGKGSSFAFRIPLHASQRPARHQLMEEQILMLEGRRILVIDGNDTRRSVLQKQLNSWKMLPVVAESGAVALELLSHDTGFDLVITHMDMPGMNGILLAKSVRKQYPSMAIMLMNPAGDERYRTDAELFTVVSDRPVRQFLLRDQLLSIFSHLTASSTGQPQMENKFSEEFALQYPLHILVAEDNAINQKIAMKILTKLGYQPLLAGDGKEVLEMISHEHYDLILMDVQMPLMDGFEATRMLRLCLEIQPVIIAMTANVMQGDRDKCIQAGMDDYISKPIEMNELLSKMSKWGQFIKDRRRVALQ
jgi:signal transduction histidine kinase/CheY-like chemotaxis protein